MVRSDCKGCGKKAKRNLSTGYCAKCFHSNVGGVKTSYNSKRWDSGIAKLSHWRSRGVVLTERDVTLFNEVTNCEICTKPFTEVKKNLDHCHITGKYRGALCLDCNTSLGKLGDNLELVILRLQAYRDKEE